MGHYDECRPGYCGGCGAGPGNLIDNGGVCPFCHPESRKKTSDKGLPDPLRTPPTPPPTPARSSNMIQQAENIPGQRHYWCNEITAWARGGLVQWRWSPPKEVHLQVKESEAMWHDCDYASRGMPNWMNPHMMFRVAGGHKEGG